MSYFGSTEFGLQASRGLIPGVAVLNKYGRNPDVDTGTTPEDIWSPGGLWTAPTAARIHDITSTSANDAAAGTGLRTLTIEGLDGSYAPQSETVTMNGVANVPTANSYTRIYRMYGTTWGSGELNAGDITATAQTDATLTAQVSTGEGQTQMAIYTVPDAKTLYLTNVYGTISRAAAASDAMCNIELQSRLNADTATRGWRVRYFFSPSATGTTLGVKYFDQPIAIPGKTDLRLVCTLVSDNDSNIAGGFGGYLIDD